MLAHFRRDPVVAYARLGQNEIGYALCQQPDGSYVNGPVAEGTPVSVNIPIRCPSGTKFVGLYHTHPGGVPYPSNTDIQSAARVRAAQLCIEVPETGQTNCFRT